MKRPCDQQPFCMVMIAPRPSGTTWTAGEVVEVAFNLMANHGGGYQYRICPAGEPLTEECFSKQPLEFVGQQALRWNAKDGKGGTQVWFDGDYVRNGTLPVGSTWAKNPIPRNDVRSSNIQR